MWASGAQWLCGGWSLGLPFWVTLTTDGQMAEPVFGQGSPLRIDHVRCVMGIRPGVFKVFAWKYYADILACARVVNDDIAFLSKADAYNQMAIWTWSFASQTIITNGNPHGQTLSNPILKFGDIAHPRHK